MSVMVIRRRSCVFLCLLFVSLCGFGQTPTHRSDPDGDDPTARRKWMQERFGTDRLAFKEQLLRAASRKKALYPNFAAGASAPLGVPIWTSIGPTSANSEFNAVSIDGVDSGRMRTILPDPGSPDTVYVLTSGGGLWKTTNFTQTPSTWVPKTDALITTGGGSAAFGRNAQTLYLGLGDPFDDFPLVGGFMVKSTDGGDNWSAPISLTNATSVRDVKIDTSTSSDIVLVATDAGLFRSTDGGANYSAVASGAGQAFNGLELWSLAKTSAGWLASAVDANDAGSLFISTDRGATWNPITNTGNVFTGAGRTTLGVSPPVDSVVYAFADVAGSIFTGGDQLDLFRSTDGGQNWTALGINSKVPTNAAGNQDQPNMDLMHDQAWYNQMVLVDPMDTSRNTVYLGGNLSSAKTINGGVTWTLTSNWLPDPAFGTGNLPYVHADFHAAAFRAGTIFFGSDGGLFVSADGGTTWASNKNIGLVTHLAYSITSNPTAPSSVITGMQDDGTRVRVGSSTIYDQTFGGDGLGVGTSQANNFITLTSTPGDEIWESSNLGLNWVSASTGLNTGDAPFFTEITSPVASADNSGKVFFSTGNHNIYETTDGAANWISIGASGSGGISSNRLIRPVPHAVGVSPIDTSHIGVAANGGVVLITSNGGASWTEEFLDTQVPGYLLNNANVAWASNTVVYACSESPVSGALRVARSGDGGSHWSAASGSLPDFSVSKLQVDPRDPTGNTVYAATFAGVYQTTNGGTTWNLFGAGLPDVHVTDMYMPADGSFLRVSTFGRGIWEINLSQPTHFTVTAPASASGGVPFTFTVTVLDAHGNTVHNYTGTVHFTSSDPVATLPADYTFVAADSGSHTFNGGAALGTPGSQTITATDTLTSSLTGFATISVTSGPASHFTVAASPTSTTAGSPVSITVTAFDAFNHTATGYRGTIHFTSSDAQATLPANYTFASADNGAHSFPGVILKTAGNPSVTVRDTATASISGSVTVAVTALSATHYSMTVPTTVTAGTPFTVRLVAQDQFNNTDHNYAGTVHFTSTDVAGGVSLPANYTFVPSENGIHLFTNAFTLQTNGTQSITATDTTTASITATVSTQVVADLPLTGLGRTIRMRSGNIPLVLATFSDADTNASPSSFTVSVNWGDGSGPDNSTVITGTQTAGQFVITGKHTYARKGAFPVVITVTDTDASGIGGKGSLLDINSTASFFPRNFSF